MALPLSIPRLTTVGTTLNDRSTEPPRYKRDVSLRPSALSKRRNISPIDSGPDLVNYQPTEVDLSVHMGTTTHFRRLTSLNLGSKRMILIKF